jgi:hypothetical protein
MGDTPRPRLLASLAITPLLVGALAMVWYAKWLVLQGYPPLRIASYVIGAWGLVGLIAGHFARRFIRSGHAAALRAGKTVPDPPPPPTLGDWCLGVLHGGLILSFALGVQNVAVTRMPIAVVATIAVAGLTWRLVLTRRWPGLPSASAFLLAAAGVATLTFGADAHARELIALMLVASLAQAVGRIAWPRLASAPANQMMAISMLAAAVVLQIAGVSRGEEFGDPPLRTTLALLIPIAVAVIVIVAMALTGPTHKGLLQRACAANVLVVVVLGEALCDQPASAATWVAAVLVAVASLLAPSEPGAESRP